MEDRLKLNKSHEESLDENSENLFAHDDYIVSSEYAQILEKNKVNQDVK